MAVVCVARAWEAWACRIWCRPYEAVLWHEGDYLKPGSSSVDCIMVVDTIARAQLPWAWDILRRTCYGCTWYGSSVVTWGSSQLPSVIS